MLKKYSQLLVHYSLKIKPRQRVLVRSTTLAEPLLKELYAELLKAGAFVEHSLAFEDQDHIFYTHASNDQLSRVSDIYQRVVEEYDAIISIMASHNLKSTANACQNKKKLTQEALAPVRKTFMKRSSKNELSWVLCVYPTQASAQECGMSLSDYEKFVYESCMLHHENPVDSWNKLSNTQQKIVDYLNPVESMRFVGLKTDLSFSLKNRRWINSDGVNNMPSGEVFSAPVENSVNGTIYFTYPTVYEGSDVQGIYLEIKDGYIENWKADLGQDVLDRVFSIEGARQFGEVAIGTNYAIKNATKNILFDEKIGGSIHMAVGASYPETGGTNESAVHWDMIKDMSHESFIYADDKCIYKNGIFLFDDVSFSDD